MKTLSIATTAVAGLVTTGLLALPVATAYAQDDGQAVKRDEETADVVLVDDEDDNDTNARAGQRDTRSNSRTGAGTNSRSRDNTGSRKSRVSRDRDRSRGDRSRDWTRDGKGGKKRDWSGNQTNDGSRNDTR